MSATYNIGAALARRAQLAPDQVALITPRGEAWRQTTYAELAHRSDRIAPALARAGIAVGDRVCVFVRPGETWVALVYALFSLGAAPVLIDPGMGRKAVLACIERIQPRGFVGIPLANALRVAFPRAFKSVRVAVTVGMPHIGKGKTLAALMRRVKDERREVAAVGRDDVAAILFTSGSTGPAKGVVYTHAMFAAQVEALRAMYAMQPGDVDLACFAPFALFGPALGLTTVLPRMNFARPSKCREAYIVAAIQVHKVVQTFGSPTIWKRVAPWCAERGLTLTSMRRLMIAGAPVSPRLVEQCRAILPPTADVHTPYGATEALPVASASGREIVQRFKARTAAGEGHCVGRPAPGVECRVIRVTDEAIESWSDELAVAPHSPGELIVRGDCVTREYAFEPEHTSAAKIRDGASFWHRMGDIVRIDGDGCIWFLCRKSHRVETAQGPLYPVAIETIFDVHPAVEKSALVGIGPRGAERPCLIVRTKPDIWLKSPRAREDLIQGILRVGRANPISAGVDSVLFRKSLPLDVRHNAKIDRGALKLWAQEQVK